MHRSESRGGWVLFFTLAMLVRPAYALDGDANSAPGLQSYYAANGLLQRGMYDLAAAEYRNFLRDQGEHENRVTPVP